jgi:hypothetical protein
VVLTPSSTYCPGRHGGAGTNTAPSSATTGDAAAYLLLCYIYGCSTKSLDIEYVISRISGERAILAKGASTHVAFDYATDRTVPLSDEFKRQVLAYQGETSPEEDALATPA